MIFVTLGTHELPFTRLLKEVDKTIELLNIQEEIIVQAGHTNYRSDRMKLYSFFSFEEMDEMYDKADLLITHAGTGSVISGIRKNKKVIAAPRLKMYGEHNDDHQLQLVDAFEAAGHILVWRDGDSLAEIIKQIDTFSPKPFVSGRDQLFGLIDRFINEA